MTDDTTPAPDAAVAPQPENGQEAPAMATFVEDAQTGAIEDVVVEPEPETIVMQPEDPAPEPAAPAEPVVTQEGNQKAPEPAPVVEEAPVPETPVVRTSAPKVGEINAEMSAGAARVAEHENRERMLASKRANEASEEKQVKDATEANKDL